MIVSIRYKYDVLIDFEVDDDDLHHLIGIKWLAVERDGKFYLCCRENGKYFHRVIMNIPKGLFVDHIDGNSCNNKKTNLRLVTPSQNSWNQNKRRSTSSSKFKGVCLYKKLNRYRAYITKHGKRIDLGYYDSEIDAAMAYNKAAREMFGEYAKLNVITNDIICLC
jgi:hypothetical protein